MYTNVAAVLANGLTHFRTRPTGKAATLAQLKAHLRIDDNTEDTYLETLLLTATESAGRYLNLSLSPAELTRQYDMQSNRPSLRAEHKMRMDLILPYGPVTEVERVYSIDTDGDETSLTEYTEDLLSQPARIHLREIITGREIAMLRIEYTAGYADESAVPSVIQHGVLMHAAYLYEHRGDCTADQARKLSGAEGTYMTYRVRPF
jgi:uncharacterized phiE125 gp8 family phage protein